MFLLIIILCFSSLPLVLIPLSHHIRAINVPIIIATVTLFFANLILGVNSIIWVDNAITRVPVWCDITTKFIIGATVILPAASLCLSKHLAHLARPQTRIITTKENRRRLIFDGCLCILFPCLVMALHYIVQGHRYNLIEDIGCSPTWYFSVPGTIIVKLPPLVLAAISSIYTGMALFRFFRGRKFVVENLRKGNSGFTPSYFTRVIALSVALDVLQLGYAIYLLAINWTMGKGLEKWISWAWVHWGFSSVWIFIRAKTPNFVFRDQEVADFGPILGSLVLFLCFGFGRDAMVDYRCAIAFFREKILRQPSRSVDGKTDDWYFKDGASRGDVEFGDERIFDRESSGNLSTICLKGNPSLRSLPIQSLSPAMIKSEMRVWA